MSAAAGFLVWIAVLLLGVEAPHKLIGSIHVFLLMGPLVVVPLGLSLVTDNKILAWTQPIGAAAAVASMFFPQGVLAAALAVPWLLVTAGIGLLGALRLWKRRSVKPFDDLFVDAALLLVPVGGGWLLASRYGAQPMGFGDIIVVLTAVHFHFAAFAAPILAGLTARKLGNSLPAIVAGGLIIVGVPMLAAGISVSAHVEVAAAFVLATGLMGLGVLQIAFVGPKLRPLAWALLGLSGLSTFVTMAFALTYALGEFQAEVFVSLPSMVAFHGATNIFGVSVCGLLGWVVATR